MPANARTADGYFLVDTQHNDRSSSLYLKGELDLGSADILSDALTPIEIAGSGPLIIDMAEVRFLDCSGLSVLLGAYNRACRDDRDLFITNAQPAVRRIFTLTGCKHLLNGSARQEPAGVKTPA
ncbi:MAG TPA: STAS domain-containing protein [Actinomycetota bacterium]|nr:STAS domain-containing protein [Actinomycetota bacterium]